MGFDLGSELGRIYHGGPYTVRAAVNRFTVAGIFRGGRLKTPATVNRFTATGKSARRDK